MTLNASRSKNSKSNAYFKNRVAVVMLPRAKTMKIKIAKESNVDVKTREAARTVLSSQSTTKSTNSSK